MADTEITPNDETTTPDNDTSDVVTPDESNNGKPKDDETIDEKVDDIEPEVRNPVKTDTKDEKDKSEDIDPEDEVTIGRVVDKRLATVNEKLNQIEQIRNETEVNSFLQGNPEYSKYKNSILKHVAHPAYTNIPIGNIAAMIASKDQQKIGAQKERAAAAAAKATHKTGQTVRKTGGSVDWSNMSQADFQAQKAKILGQV